MFVSRKIKVKDQIMIENLVLDTLRNKMPDRACLNNYNIYLFSLLS